VAMSAEMRNNATGREALSGIRDLIDELGIAKFATGELGDTFGGLSGDVFDALESSDKFVQSLAQMGVQLPKVVTGKTKFISKIRSAVVALKAMLATPVGKFLAVLAAGMAIFQAFGDNLRNLLPAQRALNDLQEQGNQIVQERAQRELAWEEGAVERLRLEREISSETATQEERLGAINRLNELNLQNAQARFDELERELAIMEQQAEIEANRVRWNDVLTLGIGRRGRVERRLAQEQEAIDSKRIEVARARVNVVQEEDRAQSRVARNSREIQRLEQDRLRNMERLREEYERINNSIRDLRISLIDDDFERAEAELLARHTDALNAVTGTEEQQKEKRLLLEQQFQNRLQDIRQNAAAQTIRQNEMVLNDEMLARQFYFDREILQMRKRAENVEEIEQEILNKKIAFAQETNQMQMDFLNKQLQAEGLSAEKRAELNNRLTAIVRQNELDLHNEKLRLVNEEREERAYADAQRLERQELLTAQLKDLASDLFNAVIEGQRRAFQAQADSINEQRRLSNAMFSEREQQLRNAVMSDARRAAEETRLAEERAIAEEEFRQKDLEQRQRQAEWEKRNAMIQAIIQTALAVTKAMTGLPLPFSLPFVAMAIAKGAVQKALIASQQIPQYAKGGTNISGLGIWGEVRPEVAVSKKGGVSVAYEPTLSNFEPGTTIYPSIDKFLATYSDNKSVSAEFDYDRFEEIVRKNKAQQTVNLDSRGLAVLINSDKSKTRYVNRSISFRS